LQLVFDQALVLVNNLVAKGDEVITQQLQTSGTFPILLQLCGSLRLVQRNQSLWILGNAALVPSCKEYLLELHAPRAIGKVTRPKSGTFHLTNP
jgi:hypothetical protein